MPEKQTKVENFEAYILKFLKLYKTVQIHLKAVTYVYLLYGPIFTNNQWGLLDKFFSSIFYLLLTIFMV